MNHPYLGRTELFTYPRNNSSHKAEKAIPLGYANFIMYMKPYKTEIDGKIRNVCSMAKTCIKPCLATAGRGAFGAVKQARRKRTRFYWQDRTGFLECLEQSVDRAVGWAERRSLTPVFRLNGTSDLPFHRMNVMQNFSDAQFYDYTKVSRRLTQKLPDNYHLTFSYDGTNMESCMVALLNGINVAAVFKNEFPAHHTIGTETEVGIFKVIDGDKHDLRFLDESPAIVGLSPKGKARKDDSVFIIN